MFELKYAITEADMKSENKKIALFYFLLYGIVAVVGLAVGIVAVVVNPQTTIFVLGIIILVFSALLFGIAVLMMVAPKNLVASVIDASEDELNVVIDKNGITVNEQNVSPFADITKIKNRKAYLVVYMGKDKVCIVKDKITSGQKLEELYTYMTERQGKLLLIPPTEQSEVDTTTESADKD